MKTQALNTPEENSRKNETKMQRKKDHRCDQAAREEEKNKEEIERGN